MLCISAFLLQLPLFFLAIAAADRFVGTWTYMTLLAVGIVGYGFFFLAYVYNFILTANRLWGPVRALVGGVLCFLVPGFPFIALLLISFEARKRLRAAQIPLGFFGPVLDPS